MRSDDVVFPASIWAIIPIFRYFSTGYSRAIYFTRRNERMRGWLRPCGACLLSFLLQNPHFYMPQAALLPIFLSWACLSLTLPLAKSISWPGSCAYQPLLPWAPDRWLLPPFGSEPAARASCFRLLFETLRGDLV